MIITKSVYEIFYSVLATTFREKEFKDVEDEIKIKLGRGLWTDKIKEEKFPRSYRITGNNTFDAEIFYRWRTIARTSDSVDAKDEVMISAFRYLEIQLPDKLIDIRLEDEILVQVLLQFFLEKFDNILLNKNPNLIVYSHKNKILKGSDRDPAVVAKKNAQENIDGISGGDSSNEFIIGSIQNFFWELKMKRFIVAHLKFSKKYGRNASFSYEKFRCGYLWSNTIDKVHIWNIQSSTSIEKSCYVSFVEVLNIRKAFEDLKLSKDKMLESLYVVGQLTEQLQLNINYPRKYEVRGQYCAPNFSLIDKYDKKISELVKIARGNDLDFLELVKELPRYDEPEQHGIGSYIGVDGYEDKKHHSYVRLYKFHMIFEDEIEEWRISDIRELAIYP